MDENNSVLNDYTAPAPVESINLKTRGVIAQLSKETGAIKVVNQDGSELFSFGVNGCPFKEEAISFLVDIYRLGFDRGKYVGRELAKQQLRDLLASQL